MADNKDSPTTVEGDVSPSAATPDTTAKKAGRKRPQTKKTAEAPTIEAQLQRLEREQRERGEAQHAQLSHLLEGLEQTFGQIHKSSSEQTQKLSTLMIGLEKTFHSIHTGTQLRDRSSNSSLEQLSKTIIRSSEEMRKEYEEMERLQEQRLAAEKERHQHSFNVLKVIAIPAIFLALLGIGYMFYTVTVMERAMTAMSKDMDSMRASMTTMTSSVGNMDGNVQSMNQNMAGMRRDMNVMTYNVAPAMDGMRKMMPWAP